LTSESFDTIGSSKSSGVTSIGFLIAIGFAVVCSIGAMLGIAVLPHFKAVPSGSSNSFCVAII